MTGGNASWGTCAPGAAENAGGWDWSDRRLEREYVWSADSSAYVDECVAQLVYTNAHEPAAGSSSGQAAYNGDDTSATVLYVLADHNANVIGLTDDRGRLVGQYAYTPYGEIRAAECFTPDSGSLASAEAVVAAKGNVLGHQGLRTERFDRPWEGALDAATATAAYGEGSYRALNHNRNRMYDPAAGRFIEQDPNGLSGPVFGGMSFGGMPGTAASIDLDIQGHFGDGMNTHAAYRGAPLSQRDSSGLSLFGVNAAWFNGDIGGGGDHDPFSTVNEFIIDDFAQKAAYLREYGKPRNYLYVAEALSFFIPGAWIEAGAERLIATRGARYLLARSASVMARMNLGRFLGGAVRIAFAPMFEVASWFARRCMGCMSGDTPVWTPTGPERLDQIQPRKLVETAGDRAIDPETGKHGEYGLNEVVELCAEMSGKSYRQVHARIERRDGSTTDVYELIESGELAQLGYESLVGTSGKAWLPVAGGHGSHGSSRSGWLKVLSIGPEMSLGSGIEIPTLLAAPVMAVFVTSEATLLAFHMEGSKEPLFMTATHPVWDAGRAEWAEAGQLVVGASIGTATGQSRIECIEVARAGSTVYNLTLAAGHTFFVGPERAWVHNIRCVDLWHHWVPQAPDIAAWAARSGITDLEKYGEYIPEVLHRAMHGNHTRPWDYLPRWRRLMAQYPNGAPTAVIANFVKHMRSYYGVGNGLP